MENRTGDGIVIAHAVPQPPAAAAEQVRKTGIAGSRLGLDPPREIVFALLGDDVDHRAVGPGAVQGRLGAPDDLDPLDIGHHQVLEIEAPAKVSGIVLPHAVHEHQCLLFLEPAELGDRRRAGRAVLLNIDARCAAQNIRNRRQLHFLQLFRRDNGDGTAQQRLEGRGSRCRDDDVLANRRRLGERPIGKRPGGKRGAQRRQ